jgi:AcrR family transcriptional regulator
MRSKALIQKARPRRDRSLTTREALLKAGEELFSEHGFSGASVDLIARRAGVNKAMISYHFGGKAGLYGAILAATLGPVTERLQGLRDAPLSAEARLVAYLDLFGALHISHPALSVMVLREILSGGPHLDARLMPHLLGLMDCVRSIVDSGVKDGTFRPVDPVMTHLSIVGSLVLFFATARFRNRLVREGRVAALAPPPEEYIRHIKEFVLRGLLAPKAAPPSKSEAPEPRTSENGA